MRPIVNWRHDRFCTNTTVAAIALGGMRDFLGTGADGDDYLCPARW